ncbi:hypothetical protein DICPUDRAFT_97049 [Dictyostelium purpureum]|uniref:C3HC-type domain-containing protein n=1 Tax=Dictyostelium purpureum TaxID=5786 RepID=F0ZDI0_DICPU|nr:uncharacterized protein DICPUDRAFT_97049 [Dictyostelium purpureum]EGC38001.1 hypothetical protein DICPUDRAFT_97049 [Dictyostelium purpureum]|eukprot:XP_003285485.1 hypothetical protein DICPUDRAFT_97049 [Dictyostelium purpureum]
MDERIKKALNDLDSATVLNQLPILSNELILKNNLINENKNNIILASDNNNSKNNNNSNNSNTGNDNNNNNNNNSISFTDSDLASSTSLLYSSYRPWNNTDYYNRVRTYTISNWFAKPTEIDPLQCSRFGWINCEPDMLECETCKKRLYFKVPPNLNKTLVTKRIQEFLKSLQSDGHRDNCPWRDNNGCPSFFSRLLDIPFQTQLDAFIKRSQNIYNNIDKLPLLSDEFHKQWNEKQKLERDNILNSIIKISNLPIDDIKSKTSCLLALCGWDFNLSTLSPTSSPISNNNNGSKEKTESSIYCSYCQRVCGIWNFIENKSKTNPFFEEPNTNTSSGVFSSSIVGSKRKRGDDEEEKQNIQFERALAQSFSFNSNNDTPKKSTFVSAFSGSFQTSFGNIYQNDSNSNKNNNTGVESNNNTKNSGWSWGESFLNSQPTDFKHALESKAKSKTEFSPVKEHRWFCPWMLVNQNNNNNNNSNNNIDDDKNESNYYNKKEINIEKEIEFEKEIQSKNNNNNNNNTNSLISGWENLLKLLLNQSTYERKDLEFKETKYHSIIKSLTSTDK